VLDGRGRPTFGGVVDDDWDDGAEAKEEKEARVDLAWGKHAGGADETPDDGGYFFVMSFSKSSLSLRISDVALGLTCKEYSATRTSEPLGLFERTYPVDTGKGAVENHDLNEARECRGDNLSEEHGSRRYLHVMAKFEVRDEVEGLRHGDVAKSFEADKG